MLVRRRVIHDIRMIFGKNGVHPLCVAHGGDQHHKLQVRMVLQQLLLDIISVIFINIHNDQPRRFMRGNLAAQLASDGAAAPRDHDHLVLHITQDGIQVHADGFPAQQILHLHVPQLAHAHLAVDQLVHARKGTQLTVGFLTDIQDIPDHRTGRGRDRDEDLVDIVKVGGFDDLVPAANHLDALDELAPFLPVVVDDAADHHGAVVAGNDLLDQRVPRFPGPDDHDGNVIFPVLHPVLAAPEEPIGKPADEQEGDQQKQIHEVVAVRHRLSRDLKQVQADPRHDGGQEAGDHQILHLVFSREGPQAVIQAEEVEDRHRQQDVERQEIPHGKEELVRNGVHMHVVAQKQRQEAGRGNAQDIIQDQRRPPVKKLIIKISFFRFFFFLHYFCFSVLLKVRMGASTAMTDSPMGLQGWNSHSTSPAAAKAVKTASGSAAYSSRRSCLLRSRYR